jgi:hypothetical protein
VETLATAHRRRLVALLPDLLRQVEDLSAPEAIITEEQGATVTVRVRGLAPVRGPQATSAVLGAHRGLGAGRLTGVVLPQVRVGAPEAAAAVAAAAEETTRRLL